MPKHYRPAGKKKEGNAAKYVTRSQAVKGLQITLPLFRKVCILKGIFPRDPKKKVKGNHQTYYHTKDISFIHHDPLLDVFREQRTFKRKIKKALSKKNRDRAKRLEDQQPKYRLDRQILERYPRFVDALRDLDDSLTMVHLFAALPTLQNEKVAPERIHNCRRLSHEWQAYIARTHKLRKTFISVKGIYYQAEVGGQKITWLTPHALQQVLTDDIDFNVLLTFLEFYEALLAFVNFKLYHSINVKYPPILDSRLEAIAAELYVLSRYIASSAATNTLDTLQENQGGQLDESQLTLAQLQHQLAPGEPGTLMQLVEETEFENNEDEETKECRSLFRNLKVYLSREVPRESLLFVISAFGGVVSWEGNGAPFEETDQSITHQIVDRPTQDHMFLSREYVQPQWIFDCVNARILLPTEEYLVGRVPPPHLSPFVDNDEVGYIPDYAEKIKRLQAAARENVLPVPAVGKDDLDDTQNSVLEGIASRVEAKEAAERKHKMLILEKQYHEELKMELQGINNASSSMPLSGAGGMEALDNHSDEDQTAEESNAMDKLVMSRNKRGLLQAMEMGNIRKRAKVDLLKSRKRRIEEGQ